MEKPENQLPLPTTPTHPNITYAAILASPTSHPCLPDNFRFPCLTPFSWTFHTQELNNKMTTSRQKEKACRESKSSISKLFMKKLAAGGGWNFWTMIWYVGGEIQIPPKKKQRKTMVQATPSLPSPFAEREWLFYFQF